MIKRYYQYINEGTLQEDSYYRITKDDYDSETYECYITSDQLDNLMKYIQSKFTEDGGKYTGVEQIYNCAFTTETNEHWPELVGKIIITYKNFKDQRKIVEEWFVLKSPTAKNINDFSQIQL